MDCYQYMTQKGLIPNYRLNNGLRTNDMSERLARDDDFSILDEEIIEGNLRERWSSPRTQYKKKLASKLKLD